MARGQGSVAAWDENFAGAFSAQIATNHGVNAANGRTLLNNLITGLTTGGLTNAQLKMLAGLATVGVRFVGESDADLPSLLSLVTW